MSEKEMFAEMFGGAAEKPKEEAKETAKAETPPEETKKEPAGEPKADEDDGVDQKLIDDAKKELGIGGAAFCDELLAGTPDAFAKLKAAGKTLHGFYNFAYSFALDEYVKANGKVDGGGFWDLAKLLGKYLDPSVKEGFTVKEPKAKPYVPPKPATSTAAKTVEKVAKKAAKAAKKEKQKKVEMKIVEPPKAEEIVAAVPKPKPIDTSDVGSIFAGIDFSKL